MQAAVPEEIRFDSYGSKEFFDWFKTARIDSAAQDRPSYVAVILHKLPYPLYCLAEDTARKVPKASPKLWHLLIRLGIMKSP